MHRIFLRIRYRPSVKSRAHLDTVAVVVEPIWGPHIALSRVKSLLIRVHSLRIKFSCPSLSCSALVNLLISTSYQIHTNKLNRSVPSILLYDAALPECFSTIWLSLPCIQQRLPIRAVVAFVSFWVWWGGELDGSSKFPGCTCFLVWWRFPKICAHVPWIAYWDQPFESLPIQRKSLDPKQWYALNK